LKKGIFTQYMINPDYGEKEGIVMKLVELKMKKAELRNQMDAEHRYHGSIDPETFIEYNEVLRKLRWMESKLLKPIVISLLLLILTTGGCYTIHGVGKDLSTWSEPYVENANR